MGNERVTYAVEWSAQEAYRRAPMRPWSVAGEMGGKVRSGGGLSFVTILDAGHLVRSLNNLVVMNNGTLMVWNQTPYDQPVRVLHMLNRWLEGEELSV